jgi:hypothetical protein
VNTLTIPHDTLDFKMKVGESFHLKFDKDGEVSHQDVDHFDPLLPKHTVGPSTPVSTHKALKKGKVDITFVPSVGVTTFSMHTILIGS